MLLRYVNPYDLLDDPLPFVELKWPKQDQGGAEENNILRENFSRPTQCADKKFRGPLAIALNGDMGYY